ncbi:MAG TPA: hypothetical protein VHO69_06960 [Phototrophicaceae bacterium]|nr:hypothetical protein [Phototrophicaceae bacterium]
MSIRLEIESVIREYLGDAALKVQAEYGRGAWIMTPDNQAAFVTYAELPDIFGGGSQADFDAFIKLVEVFDPTRQVVVLFNYSDNAQSSAVVDIY